MSAPDRIETEADLVAGAAVLVARDARFRPILEATGPLPLRRRPDGFGALLAAIVGQQVSTASAAAILARLEAAGLAEEAAVAAAADEDLRACGLSRPKIRYVRALAAARLDYEGLRAAPAELVVERLVALPGIGRWTAEIYAMFALGHVDVFPAGDLALQVAAGRAFDLPARPAEAQLRALAGDWSPVRAVAACALWAYYRLDTSREGVL
ncbi:DNA-3-methyladenine glycosylase family protein [Roseicyclus marinus]|uniref:DNA-3-methyladenine glycosylase family protein n=1 Tax=Roseicyclus marinus TaxID=2161673 RepID=UPI0024106DF6|nr:DNA-3-methyladenine glycosylase 2 family protein [Roseicyclus marinus]MDG3040125.1 DNA-3-methyladenine glycosylase 2 family protein [Roseicyclus marinus]